MQAADVEVLEHPPGTAKRRVLIADDSPTVTAMVSHILERAGYAVLAAADGLSAINLALREVPDLIISDVEMPGLTGLQLCRLLKGDSRVSGIPVIMLSSHKEQHEQFWGLQTGADDYLPKPFRPEALLAHVAALVPRDPHPAPVASPEPPTVVTTEEALERVNALLERRLFELTIVHGIGTLAAATRDQRDVTSAILGSLSRLVDFAAAAVAFAPDGASHVQIGQSIHPQALERLHAELMAAVAPLAGPVPTPVLLGGVEYVTTKAPPRGVAVAIQPLLTPSGSLGALGIAREGSRPLAGAEQRLLELVASPAALLLENVRLQEAEREHAAALQRQAEKLKDLNAQLATLSFTDGLTGLWNRRYLNQRLDEEVRRARRAAQPLSCLMVDLDHFKGINDRFGHQQGDLVLQMVAGAIRQAVRSSDVVGRYGGEEFCIITPAADLEGAAQIGERIRAGVAEGAVVVDDEAIRVTVSVGVAQLGEEGDATALVAAADQALYAAKAAGRNRVITASALACP
ncbi:MAG: diguanylate cyclase [Armatimonadetes bacterium]|nr:diguanylate cyclase [Armatimonadota bacterium]